MSEVVTSWNNVSGSSDVPSGLTSNSRAVRSVSQVVNQQNVIILYTQGINVAMSCTLQRMIRRILWGGVDATTLAWSNDTKALRQLVIRTVCETYNSDMRLSASYVPMMYKR